MFLHRCSTRLYISYGISYPYRSFSASTFRKLATLKDTSSSSHVEKQEFLKNLQNTHFPPPFAIDLIIGYGSAFVPQSGYSSDAKDSGHPATPSEKSIALAHDERRKEPLLDFLFVLPDDQVANFHKTNLVSHPSHYPLSLRLFSHIFSSSYHDHGDGTFLAKLQRSMGPGLYYITDVQLSPYLAKYGLVSSSQFIKDCLVWDHMYIAGRLQKPFFLHSKSQVPRKYLDAIEQNRRSALVLSLLLLKLRGTQGEEDKSDQDIEFELLTTIVSLSYAGDPRMSLAVENPYKIQNIVMAQRQALRDIYLPKLDELLSSSESDSQKRPRASLHKCIQDLSPSSVASLLTSLPSTLQTRIKSHYPNLSFPSRPTFSHLDSHDTHLSSSAFWNAALRQPDHSPSEFADTIRKGVCEHFSESRSYFECLP